MIIVGSLYGRPKNVMPTGSPCGVKPAGTDHRGDVNQERVEVRRALLIDVRRIDAVLDQRRRVLDRLVDDGVEPVVRHDLHDRRSSARRAPTDSDMPWRRLALSNDGRRITLP